MNIEELKGQQQDAMIMAIALRSIAKEYEEYAPAVAEFEVNGKPVPTLYKRYVENGKRARRMVAENEDRIHELGLLIQEARRSE